MSLIVALSRFFEKSVKTQWELGARLPQVPLKISDLSLICKGCWHRCTCTQHRWLFCTLPRYKIRRSSLSSFLQLIVELSQFLLATVSLHISFSSVLGFVFTGVSHSRHSNPDLPKWASYHICICKDAEKCIRSQLWRQESISQPCVTQKEEAGAITLIYGLVVQMQGEKRKGFSWGQLVRSTKTLQLSHLPEGHFM